MNVPSSAHAATRGGTLPLPGSAATAGFACFALYLAVLATPPARDSVALLLALLGFVVGVGVLLAARGPPSARYAAAAAGAYVLVLFFLFVASTPYTIGRYKWFVNETPPAWAVDAFPLVLEIAPVLFAIAIAAALWAWSGVAGRVAIAVGAALLGAFLFMHFTQPDAASLSTEAIEAVKRRAGVMDLLLSAGALANLAAVALVLARKPLDLDWG